MGGSGTGCNLGGMRDGNGRSCPRVRQVIGSPPQSYGCDQAGRPGGALHPTAMLSGRDSGAASKRIEWWWKLSGRAQLGQECGSAVAQCRNSIPKRLTGGTRRQMAFDLDTLGAAKCLVEIGVELLFRNVPHDLP